MNYINFCSGTLSGIGGRYRIALDAIDLPFASSSDLMMYFSETELFDKLRYSASVEAQDIKMGPFKVTLSSMDDGSLKVSYPGGEAECVSFDILNRDFPFKGLDFWKDFIDRGETVVFRRGFILGPVLFSKSLVKRGKFYFIDPRKEWDSIEVVGEHSKSIVGFITFDGLRRSFVLANYGGSIDCSLDDVGLPFEESYELKRLISMRVFSKLDRIALDYRPGESVSSKDKNEELGTVTEITPDGKVKVKDKDGNITEFDPEFVQKKQAGAVSTIKKNPLHYSREASLRIAIITDRGSQKREPLSESGFDFVEKDGDDVVLKCQEDGHYELWTKRDDSSGYVIVINGKGYEFMHSVNPEDIGLGKASTSLDPKVNVSLLKIKADLHLYTGEGVKTLLADGYKNNDPFVEVDPSMYYVCEIDDNKQTITVFDPGWNTPTAAQDQLRIMEGENYREG